MDTRTTTPLLLPRTRTGPPLAGREATYSVATAVAPGLAEQEASAREPACDALDDYNLPRRGMSTRTQIPATQTAWPARGGKSGSIGFEILPGGYELSRRNPIHLFCLIFGIIGTHSESRKEAYRIFTMRPQTTGTYL